MRKITLACLIGVLALVVLFGTGPALSAEQNSAPDASENSVSSTDEPPAEVSPPADWMEQAPGDVEVPWKRMVYGLGIVIALVCFGVYVLKKVGGARFGGGQYLNVLEVVPLGNKSRLMLVQVGSSAVLLAFQGDNVERVGEFEMEHLPTPPDTEDEGEGGFATILRQVVRGEACSGN